MFQREFADMIMQIFLGNEYPKYIAGHCNEVKHLGGGSFVFAYLVSSEICINIFFNWFYNIWCLLIWR
jgi:hypothetical protein